MAAEDILEVIWPLIVSRGTFSLKTFIKLCTFYYISKNANGEN